MRLVEDDGVVLGQHAAAGGQVGEVERVVRDHEVRLARLARALGEAAREERAAAAGATVGADRELGPERLRRLDLELGAVAGLGLGEPGLQRLERLLVARVAKQHRAEALELLAADIVLAALEHRDPDLAPERARRRGHVLGEQLLLERLRRGRDDDALPRLERRQQVGEALAVPVPASATRCSPVASASSTAAASAACSARGSKPGSVAASAPPGRMSHAPSRKRTQANGCSPSGLRPVVAR